jgi:transcriptional regulator with XRE-family HTH domain
MPAPLGPATTTLGTNVRERRLNLGLTHRDLANRTNIAATTISNIELGKIANPGVYTLYPLALALGASFEELMGTQRLDGTTKARVRRRATPATPARA